MLELINISKEYFQRNRKCIALENVSYKFINNGFYFIYGKSGCGKSTLLNLICGLENPTNGIVVKDDTDSVGIVFQSDNLINNFTVLENLMIFTNDINKINEYVKKFDLYDVLNTKVRYLSSGEKQRVSIIRCLIQDNNILLFDEATANLDKELSIEILKLLKELSKDKLIIFVSHDYGLISLYSDYILKMENGKIIEETIQSGKDNIDILKSESAGNKFRFKLIWKYFIDILISKKITNLIGIIILSISMIFVIVAFHLRFYDTSDTIGDSLAEVKYSYIPVKYKAYSDFSDTHKYVYKSKNLFSKLNNDLVPVGYISTYNLNGVDIISPEIYIKDEVSLVKGDMSGLVISSFLAEYYFGDEEPIGKKLKLGVNNCLLNSNIEFVISGIAEVEYKKEDLRKFKSFESYRTYNYDILKRYYCSSYISNDYLINNVMNKSVYLNGFSFDSNLSIGEYVNTKTKIYNSKYFNEINIKGNDVVISSNYKMYVDKIPYGYNIEDLQTSPNYSLYGDAINLYEVTDKINVIELDNSIDGIIISEELYNEIIDRFYLLFFTGIAVKKENLSKENVKYLSGKDISFNLNEYILLYHFSDTMNNELARIINGISVMVVLITIMFLLYSSLNIYNLKQKELYVLKAFKIHKKRLFLPFLLFEITLFLISLCIAIPGAYYILNYLCNFFSGNYNVDFTYKLLELRLDNLCVSILVGLFFIFISIILPFIKIIKNEVNIGIKNS